MAQPTGYSPVYVISPRFCLPTTVDLAVTKHVWQIFGRRKFVVNDVNGDLMFKVERSFFCCDCTRVILDASQSPIVTLRRKALSAHSRWQVFRGESTEYKDLIFSARRSSMFQMKTKLHVFLANNVSEDVCDYMVQGSWFQSSCEVYVGDSSTIIAQMQKNSSIGSIFTGENMFMVRVCPNIDYAFIAALIVILDEINSHAKRRSINTRRH